MRKNMNTLKTNKNDLMRKINEILNDFQNFEQPFVNNEGDIIIRKNKGQLRNKFNC